MRTDAEGLLELKVSVHGAQDVLLCFVRQSSQSVILSHGDYRIVGEAISNLVLGSFPVAPGSVALRLSEGIATDGGLDGRLTLETPANGAPGGSYVGSVDYFSGRLALGEQWLAHRAVLRADGCSFAQMSEETFEVDFNGDGFTCVYFSTEDNIADAIEAINMQLTDGYAERGLYGINIASKKIGKQGSVCVRNASPSLEEKLGIANGSAKSQPPIATYIQTKVIKAGSRMTCRVNGSPNDQLVMLGLSRSGSSKVRVEI